MKKYLSIFPTRSLIYFLICGVGLLVFVFLIIIPTQKTSAELDKDIEKLSARIEEQRILKPVFDSLLKRVKKKNPTELPAVKKVQLNRGDISKISDSLLEFAKRHDLKLQDIQTDVNALASDKGYLLMRLKMAGDFMRFRDFLVDLGRIPSLEQIEEIQIRAVEASREFKLKIRLAQK